MSKTNNLREQKDRRQELRNNMSVPEKILWKWIRNEQLGHKFRRQHGIGKFIADFYCSELNLVVEVDGRIHGEEIVAEKDKYRDEVMFKLGLKIKRYTANDVNNNLEWVLDDLRKCCDLLAPPPHQGGARGGLPSFEQT
ncbi:MAG: endonuclease domain-containing protein [Patescibacteria group bacterium]